MSLFNCEINLISTWSENFIDDQVPTFAITDTKFYVPENVNYQINYNQVLIEQLTGINTNQNQQCRHKTNTQII